MFILIVKNILLLFFKRIFSPFKPQWTCKKIICAHQLWTFHRTKLSTWLPMFQKTPKNGEVPIFFFLEQFFFFKKTTFCEISTRFAISNLVFFCHCSPNVKVIPFRQVVLAGTEVPEEQVVNINQTLTTVSPIISTCSFHSIYFLGDKISKNIFDEHS